MKYLSKKCIIFLAVVFGAPILSIGIIFALGTYNTGYKVDSGAGAQDVEIDSGGTCKRITNTSGNDYFIPTKTSAEWTAFEGNTPNDVTIEACGGTWQYPSGPPSVDCIDFSPTLPLCSIVIGNSCPVLDEEEICRLDSFPISCDEPLEGTWIREVKCLP